MKRTGPSNYQLQQLLTQIKDVARESPFWKRIAKDLAKPSRQRRSVNLYKINNYAKGNEIVCVPGKVLSVGEITKKIDVAALNFSVPAREKILKLQGRVMTIQELLAENPQGKKVRILG